MNGFEARILMWIQNNVRVEALDGIIGTITHLGDTGILWICVTAVLLIFRKTRKIGCVCAGSMLLTMILVNCTIKPIMGRTRPFDLEEFREALVTLVSHPRDFSFPSGHSSNGFACAWVLFRSERKRIGIPALIMASIIALSRLYVGVHYPTDVIVGTACGIVCAEMAIRFVPEWVSKISAKVSKRK